TSQNRETTPTPSLLLRKNPVERTPGSGTWDTPQRRSSQRYQSKVDETGNIREDLPLRLRARIADAIHCLRRHLQLLITSRNHRFLRPLEIWRPDLQPSRAETRRRDQESACRSGLGSLPV